MPSADVWKQQEQHARAAPSGHERFQLNVFARGGVAFGFQYHVKEIIIIIVVIVISIIVSSSGSCPLHDTSGVHAALLIRLMPVCLYKICGVMHALSLTPSGMLAKVHRPTFHLCIVKSNLCFMQLLRDAIGVVPYETESDENGTHGPRHGPLGAGVL